MKNIKITNEQRNNLKIELTMLTLEFSKYESIKGIYFAPYKGLGKISDNLIELTLVADSNINKSFLSLINSYNKIYSNNEALKQYGIRILIDIDDMRKYTLYPLNNAEIKRHEYLYNSTILLDKTGLLTELKEYTINTKKFQSFKNKANIIPPLLLNSEDNSVKRIKSRY